MNYSYIEETEKNEIKKSIVECFNFGKTFNTIFYDYKEKKICYDNKFNLKKLKDELYANMISNLKINKVYSSSLKHIDRAGNLNGILFSILSPSFKVKLNGGIYFNLDGKSATIEIDDIIDERYLPAFFIKINELFDKIIFFEFKNELEKYYALKFGFKEEKNNKLIKEGTNEI